jgi:protein subunit release factor B
MKESLLEQAIVLTQQMLDQAEKKDYESLPEVEKKRQLVLDKTFPVSPQESSVQLKAKLEMLISLNAKLEQQCQQAKQELQKELQGMNRNKKAMSAYASV